MAGDGDVVWGVSMHSFKLIICVINHWKNPTKFRPAGVKIQK